MKFCSMGMGMGTRTVGTGWGWGRALVPVQLTSGHQQRGTALLLPHKPVDVATNRQSGSTVIS